MTTNTTTASLEAGPLPSESSEPYTSSAIPHNFTLCCSLRLTPGTTAVASGLTWPGSDTAQRATQQNTICVKVWGAVVSSPQRDISKGHSKEPWEHVVAQRPPPALGSQHTAQGQDPGH